MTRAMMRGVALAVVVWAAVPRPSVGAACIGDCNGDGIIKAGELTVIINRVVACDGSPTGPCGSVTVPDCANADKNGDNRISAGELTNAIANVLNGCEQETTATAITQPTMSVTPTPVPTDSPQPTITRTATATFTATGVPTDAPTHVPTPAPTATARAAVCGNGIIEKGETCTNCATDCRVGSCTATSTVTTFATNFAPPLGQDASSVTALVGYRSNTVSLPGKGTGSCQGGSKNGKACSTGTDCPGGQCILPRSRVKNTPPGSIVGVNDLDYAVRVVVTRSSRIAPGRLFTVDFDLCQGATAPTAADFSCTVEGCASSFGSVDGCTCTVVAP